MNEKIIVEKKLGIPADYQYRAIRSKNFLQKNWHKNKLIVVKRLLNLTKQMRVLDLGTGSGNFEFTFSKFVSEVVGVDYNDEALKFLKIKLKTKKIRNVKLYLSDIRELEKLKNIGKFDLIVMLDVIEHIKIGDAKKLISKFRKLLNDQGFVFIVTPNYHSPWLIIEKILDKFTIVPKFGNEQHLAKFHKKNLTQIFEKSGFTTGKIASFNLFSYLFPQEALSRKLLNIELAMPYPIGNLLVGLFKKWR